MKAHDYKNIKKFEKSQINGLTKKISGLRFNVNSYNTSDMWDSIFKEAENMGLEVGYAGNYYGERLDFKNPRKITKEQTSFGKAWLKDFYFKKNGQPRSGKRLEHLDTDVLKIAKKVSRFEFVGIGVLASQGWFPVNAVPIYRAFDSEGNSFDYSPIHWNNPIIDNVEYKEEV